MVGAVGGGCPSVFLPGASCLRGAGAPPNAAAWETSDGGGAMVVALQAGGPI